jgi:hypothetical protein
MKSLFILCISILFSTIIFSQENDETPYSRDYLGIYNGNATYCTGLSRVRTNTISLFNIQDDNVIRIETFGLGDDIFEQIFLYENKIYGLVSDRKETTYSLVRFNKDLQEEERISIMPYKKGGMSRIRIIQHSGKVLFHLYNNREHLAVIDLENMKSQYYRPSFSMNFTSFDVLFFNETDAHIICQNGLTVNYATLINGTMDDFKISYKNPEVKGIATLFRFVTIDDHNYLFSTLHTAAKPITGYTFTEIEGLKISEIKINKIINDKLYMREAWQGKDYKAWKNRRFRSKMLEATLDEVLILNNQLIYSVRFHRPEIPHSNIFIGSINIVDKNATSANWNIVTKSGHYNDMDYRQNLYTHKYMLAPLDTTLRLFYTCHKKVINEKGEVLPKHKKYFLPRFPKASLAIMEINLSNGTYNYLKNPYADSKHNSPSTDSPFFFLENNYIYFLSEEMIYHGPTVSTQPRMYHYKPTVLKFPIDYTQ